MLPQPVQLHTPASAHGSTPFYHHPHHSQNFLCPTPPPMIIRQPPPTVFLTAQSVERCQYRSKFCRNHRALKANGKMHRLCDFHRFKANENQKRWAEARRAPSEDGEDDMKSEPQTDASDRKQSQWIDDSLWFGPADDRNETEELLAPMSPQELNMLISLLADDDSSRGGRSVVNV